MKKLEKQTLIIESNQLNNFGACTEIDQNAIMFWFLLNSHFFNDIGNYTDGACWHFIYVRTTEVLQTINYLYDGYSKD